MLCCKPIKGAGNGCMSTVWYMHIWPKVPSPVFNLPCAQVVHGIIRRTTDGLLVPGRA